MGRQSWVVELGKDWRNAYDGTPPWGHIGRAMKELIAEKGLERVQQHWRRYLNDTPGRFASPTRFAETFGTWGNGTRPEKPKVPRTTKVVVDESGKRARLTEVSLDDPREAV
jgi:hypothetical protein